MSNLEHPQTSGDLKEMVFETTDWESRDTDFRDLRPQTSAQCQRGQLGNSAGSSNITLVIKKRSDRVNRENCKERGSF